MPAIKVSAACILREGGAVRVRPPAIFKDVFQSQTGLRHLFSALTHRHKVKVCMQSSSFVKMTACTFVASLHVLARHHQASGLSIASRSLCSMPAGNLMSWQARHCNRCCLRLADEICRAGCQNNLWRLAIFPALNLTDPILHCSTQ